MSKGAHVTLSRRHVEAVLASAVRVELQLFDRSTMYATVVRRDPKAAVVAVRVWGARRLRVMRFEDVRLASPVQGVTWLQAQAIGERQRRGERAP
jgi:hypothetical protein